MELLVIGWKTLFEDALERLGVPHVTAVELAKFERVRTKQDSSRRLIPCGDCESVEAVLGALARSGIDTSRIRHVWGPGEFTLATASAIAAILGVQQCPPMSAVIRFRDKSVQKSVIRSAGLPVADCVVLDSVASLEDYLSSGTSEPTNSAIALPGVLKPIAGAGTRNTVRVDTPEDLRRELTTLLHQDPVSGPFLLEQFIIGEEMHLDGCWRDGALTAFAASTYFTPVLEVRTGAVAGSLMLDPTAHENLYEQVRDFAQAALEALGLDDGVFHMEVFRTRDGIVFSECAARTGGNGIVETFAGKFGLSLVEEHAKAVLGLPAGIPEGRDGAFGLTLLQAPAGVASTVPSREELLSREGVLDGLVVAEVGKPMVDMSRSSMSFAGSAVLTAASEAELIERIMKLRAWFFDAVKIRSDEGSEPADEASPNLRNLSPDDTPRTAERAEP